MYCVIPRVEESAFWQPFELAEKQIPRFALDDTGDTNERRATMTRTTTHNALADLGTGDPCAPLCGNPVDLIAQGHNPMNLRSRAALVGGDS